MKAITKTIMMLLCVSVVPKFVAAGQTTEIVNESKSVVVKTPQDFGFKCSPGIADNGSNYPTPSEIKLSDFGSILPAIDAQSILALDNKSRYGDHCKELASEFASILPANLTINRIVVEYYNWIGTTCVKTLSEQLIGKIADYEFGGGSFFRVGEVDAGNCAAGSHR